MMKYYDPKLVKILGSYDPNIPEPLASEDLAYAQSSGVIFEKSIRTHDELVQWAFDEFGRCSKKSVTDSFLIGVGRNLPHARAAISAYAVMTHLPDHPFETLNGNICATCGMWPQLNLDMTFINSCRWAGGLIGHDPSVLAVYLWQHNQDHIDTPSEAEIAQFVAILDFISQVPNDENPTKLGKKIRKITGVKMNLEEVRIFIDTLGYCGILQTPKHQGFIYQYPGYLTPRKSHSSDWAYPVDFWLGEHGINLDALQYWFSDYPQLANWKPSIRI